MKNLYLFAVVISMVSFNANAAREPREPVNFKPAPQEVVKWVGEISDSSSDHTTLHDHNLEFKNRETGERYNIVDSPELVKLHHETEKNYLVEIEAEKTSRFLFWGGNLVVKNFKVLNDTASVPHLNPPSPVRSIAREASGGRNRY